MEGKLNQAAATTERTERGAVAVVVQEASGLWGVPMAWGKHSTSSITAGKGEGQAGQAMAASSSPARIMDHGSWMDADGGDVGEQQCSTGQE